MNDGVATRAYQRLFQLGRVAGQTQVFEPPGFNWCDTPAGMDGNESGTKLGEQLIRRAIDQCLAVTVDASYREINFRRPQRGDNGRRHLG